MMGDLMAVRSRPDELDAKASVVNNMTVIRAENFRKTSTVSLIRISSS